MFNFQKCLLAVSVAGALGVAGIAAPTAFAAPITFSSDADYNNALVQTTGVFRDFLLGDGSESTINRGTNLSGTVYTALNFTGVDNTTSPFGRVTLYDTTPIDATVKNLFTGDLTLSADILIHTFDNGKGAGLVTLFNEGVGKTGLALLLQDAGNTEGLLLKLVQQDGVATANVASVNLSPNNIALDEWYRLTMSLDITGTSFTITGTVFRHLTGTDPTSGLGLQVGSTLTHNGTLDAALSDPYEIGLVARGINQGPPNGFGVSVTNFCIDGCPTATPTVDVPEPGTMLLLGIGLAGLIGRARKRLEQ